MLHVASPDEAVSTWPHRCPILTHFLQSQTLKIVFIGWTPPHGLSEARRGRKISFESFLVTDRSGGVLQGRQSSSYLTDSGSQRTSCRDNPTSIDIIQKPDTLSIVLNIRKLWAHYQSPEKKYCIIIASKGSQGRTGSISHFIDCMSALDSPR